MEIPINKQIKCVDREITKRKYVYPKLIAAGKLTIEEANLEIATILAVRDTLVKVYEGKTQIKGEQLGLGLQVSNQGKY